MKACESGEAGQRIRLAFLTHPRTDGRESTIVERLRCRGELAPSLVARVEGRLVGHVAFSPVRLTPAGAGFWRCRSRLPCRRPS